MSEAADTIFAGLAAAAPVKVKMTDETVRGRWSLLSFRSLPEKKDLLPVDL